MDRGCNTHLDGEHLSAERLLVGLRVQTHLRGDALKLRVAAARAVDGALDVRRDFKLLRRLDRQARLHVRRQLEIGHELVGDGAQLHVERVEEVDGLGPAQRRLQEI